MAIKGTSSKHSSFHKPDKKSRGKDKIKIVDKGDSLGIDMGDLGSKHMQSFDDRSIEHSSSKRGAKVKFKNDANDSGSSAPTSAQNQRSSQ